MKKITDKGFRYVPAHDTDIRRTFRRLRREQREAQQRSEEATVVRPLLRRRRQAGFGMIELGIALGILAVLAALAFAVHAWWEDHNETVREAGRAEVRQAYMKRDNAKLQAAAEKIRQLEEAARGEEQRRAEAVNAATKVYVKERNDAKHNLEVLRAAVRDGSLLLRDPGGASGAGCPGGGERSGSEVAAASGGGDGRIGGGGLPEQSVPVLPGAAGSAGSVTLSAQATEFLLLEAARANALIGKLRLLRVYSASCYSSSPQ